MTKILTVLALAMMVGVAQARPGEEYSGERLAPPHELLIENADAIGLDALTISEIRDIAEENRDRMEALHESAREQMHGAGREVMEEILPPPPGEQSGERPQR